MRKSRLTRRILTGLVLLVGASGAITVANEINNAAMDINSKNVKATIIEKNGHYYVQLTADKDVKNVVARITTEDKKEYLVKKDEIKIGEVIEYEIDVNAEMPTKKLPHTAVKRETVKNVVSMGNHTFTLTVRYDIEDNTNKDQPLMAVSGDTTKNSTLDQLVEKREVTAEEKIKEAEAKAKQEAEAKAKQEAEVKAKQEAEAKAKQEAEAKAKQEAEAKAKQEAEAKAKQEAEAKAKQEAEVKVKQEAEIKAKQEAEAKAKQEAEAKAKQEAEVKAKQAAGAKLKQEAEAKKVAETKAKQEAEAKAKQEAEAKAKQEAEVKAKQETEAKAKQESDAKLKQGAEAKAKQDAAVKAKQEAEAKQGITVAKGLPTVTAAELDDPAMNGLTDHAKKMKVALAKKFGITSFSMFRAGDDDGTGHGHNTGMSVDFMVPVGSAQGDQLAEYLTKNMNELGVYYIIWKQRFYMPQFNIYGPANTWNLMPDRGGVTANHYDHVHVSFVK